MYPISSASLPLKLDDRGKPVEGAIARLPEAEWEIEEDDSPKVGGVVEAIAARYWMTFLVFSVFPAPDSPLQTINY